MYKILGRFRSGEIVLDKLTGGHLEQHPDAVPYVMEALRKIETNGRDFIEKTVDLRRPIGITTCVATTDADEIVFAQRVNRLGLTRFVKNREGTPCSGVVVVAKLMEETSEYLLITSYIGVTAPLEPWDEKADERSLPFWNTHALVWDPAHIIPGTETSQCPW